MILAYKKIDSTKYNPKKQLECLRLQCKDLKKTLYKTNATYLNLLRQILPVTIRQSVFLLITEHNDYHVDLSSSQSRQSCFQKIDKLVANSSSKITIEQLMQLADEIEKEKNKKLETDQLESLTELNTKQLDADITNSVELNYSPPIEKSVGIDNYFKDDLSFLSEDLVFNIDDNSYFNKSEDNDLSPSENNDDSKSIIKSKLSKIGSIKNDGIQALQKLLMLSGEASSSSDDVNLTNIDYDSVGDNLSREDFLPENPLELFYWMNSIEIALVRSLRNLSNSINIELLRSGLINNLMPVSLLDAVISGQVYSQDSPSNLLRIEVPVGTSSINEKVDISCLLICPTDLEFDNPKLRKCKSYLNKHRNLLVKMIKQQRHWQNRSLANEVSQQWLKTPPKIQKDNISNS